MMEIKNYIGTNLSAEDLVQQSRQKKQSQQAPELPISIPPTSQEWIEKEQKRLKDLHAEEEVAASTDEIRRMELLRDIESAPATQRVPVTPHADGDLASAPLSSGDRMIQPNSMEVRVAGTVKTAESAPTSSGRVATHGPDDLPPYAPSVMNPEEQTPYKKAA